MIFLFSFLITLPEEISSDSIKLFDDLPGIGKRGILWVGMASRLLLFTVTLPAKDKYWLLQLTTSFHIFPPQSYPSFLTSSLPNHFPICVVFPKPFHHFPNPLPLIPPSSAVSSSCLLQSPPLLHFCPLSLLKIIVKPSPSPQYDWDLWRCKNSGRWRVWVCVVCVLWQGFLRW